MAHCDNETLTVHVTGEPNEHYGDLLGDAIRKAEERLPGATIHRTWSACGGVGGFGAEEEEWYLGCGHAALGNVGTKLEGSFTFVRHRGLT